MTPDTPPSASDRGPSKPAASRRGRNSDFGNIVALLFVAALALGGLWLFRTLEHHNEIQNCIASGRRNCVDLVHPDASEP